MLYFTPLIIYKFKIQPFEFQQVEVGKFLW